jgi:GT2 family glycosyltransferase
MALLEEFPSIVVLSGDGNLWWAGAMNIGVGWVLARAGEHDVVVSLNNDTVAPPGYLERLLQAHASARDALIGSVLVSASDCRTVIDGGVHVTWATAKYHTAARGTELPANSGVMPELESVDLLSGCGTLIPARAFRRAGPYRQDRLRHYAADFEFSRRALRYGFALLVDWASPLYVHEDQTGIHAAVASAGMRGLLRSFWSMRSANDIRMRLAFAMSACPRWALPLYIPLDYARVTLGSLRRTAASRPSTSTADPRSSHE